MAVQTILVVDDSPTERHFLSTLLTKHGYRVELAENGKDGIEMAKKLQPDLIIMDVIMPDLNGFQATRTITKAEDTKHIPVILCTTKDQETDKIWGFRQGAVNYIIKPVDKEALLKIVRSL